MGRWVFFFFLDFLADQKCDWQALM